MKKILFTAIFVMVAHAGLTQTMTVKDSDDNILMEVNDEGKVGSITLPAGEKPSTTDDKLYNVKGSLFWNDRELGTAASAGGWTASEGTVCTTTLTDNVGINTITPEFKLSLDKDGGIFAKGKIDSGAVLGTSGMGTRLIWYPRRAAFRAGYVDGTQWNDGSIGNLSVALGNCTTASGFRSTAMGNNTTASGDQSTAMGSETEASNDYSTAMGSGTIASGAVSTAMGGGTTASGDYSTATGGLTTSIGDYSTAMGNSTTASGSTSTAMGVSTTAGGDFSTAMGCNTTASGSTSTAMGNNTAASGYFSTAMGSTTTASGVYSTAMGISTTAESWASVAIGQRNVGGGTPDSWVPADPIFEIGIGEEFAPKANAVTVLKNGKVGIGPSDPSSLLDVTGDIETGSGNAFYFGEPFNFGSWRIVRSGDNLVFQRRESGSWVTKSTISS